MPFVCAFSMTAFISRYRASASSQVLTCRVLGLSLGGNAMEKINISALSCWRSGGELAEQRLLGVWQGSDVHARMPSVTCPSAFFIMSIQELTPKAPTCSCGTSVHTGVHTCSLGLRLLACFLGGFCLRARARMHA